jgi:hypothetical protein
VRILSSVQSIDCSPLVIYRPRRPTRSACLNSGCSSDRKLDCERLALLSIILNGIVASIALSTAARRSFATRRAPSAFTRPRSLRGTGGLVELHVEAFLGAVDFGLQIERPPAARIVCFEQLFVFLNERI